MNSQARPINSNYNRAPKEATGARETKAIGRWNDHCADGEDRRDAVCEAGRAVTKVTAQPFCLGTTIENQGRAGMDRLTEIEIMPRL